MRKDEIEQRREQRKHMLVELRSLGSRYDVSGAPWSKPDAERRDYLLSSVTKINEELHEVHRAELEEIRSARGSNDFQATGLERSFAPEPLYKAFRSAGFARGERAEIPWQEFRSITWTGSVDNLNSLKRAAGALGYDQRYAYQALPSVGVDSGVSSVSILTQTARTLATPANVIRAIDAVTAKPETTETLTVSTVALKQLASVVSDIPNIFIENEQAGSIIENDLKLAITDALDDLVKTAVAASGFQAPGTDPLLISIRKAMSTVMSSGYSPGHADSAACRRGDVGHAQDLRLGALLRLRTGQLRSKRAVRAHSLHLEDRRRSDRHGRVSLREDVRLAALAADVRAGRRPDEQEPRPHRAQRAGRRRAPGGSGQDRGLVMAEKKSAKSSYVVRTDHVLASSGKPSFYGEKVKLSDEEAKPLLTEGKVSKE